MSDCRTIPWLAPSADFQVTKARVETLAKEHCDRLRPFGLTETFPVVFCTHREIAETISWSAEWPSAWYEASTEALRRVRSKNLYQDWRHAVDEVARFIDAFLGNVRWSILRDCSADLAWRLVVDELPPNPFFPLMQMWELGCWPIGVAGKVLHIYCPDRR